MLTSKMLVFSDLDDDTDNNDESETTGLLSRKNTVSSVSSLSSFRSETADSSELHFGEAWFHRNLPRGRSSAEEILR